MKILITAFEPFASHESNASETLLLSLPNHYRNTEIIKKTLPVVYEKAYQSLLSEVDEEISAIVMLGLAAESKTIRLERIAVNLNDSKTADNQGTIIQGACIDPSGHDGYFSTLPLRLIYETTIKKDLPVSISPSAGTYVCNDVMYRVLHYISNQQRMIPAGFIHVPHILEASKEALSLPGLELKVMQETMMSVLDKLIDHIYS